MARPYRGAHRRRVAMPRCWHLRHEEQPRDHRVDRGTWSDSPPRPRQRGRCPRPDSARRRGRPGSGPRPLPSRRSPGARRPGGDLGEVGGEGCILVPPAVELGADPTARPAVRPAGVRGRRSTSSAATAPYPPGAAAPSAPRESQVRPRRRLTECRAFLDRRRGGILPASSKRFHRAGELRIDWTEPLLRRSAMGVASSGVTDGMPVTGSYVEVTGPRWSVRTATKAFPQPW